MSDERRRAASRREFRPLGGQRSGEAASVGGSYKRDTIDPRIDALLRGHSTPSPPAHVDAAILAAAHRAVGSGPRKARSPLAGGPLRWWMPLAAAAVIGVVAIGILPLAPDAPRPSPAVVDDATATARRDAPERERVSKAPFEFAASPPNAPAQSAPAASIARAPSPKSDRAPLSTRKDWKSDSTATESRKSTASEPTAADRDTAAGANVTAPRSPAPQAAAGAIGESADSDARRASADWIVRIRALRNAGDVAEACAELARFRAAFDDADARLPADLRAWAASLR